MDEPADTARSEPARVRIPAINIDAALIELGLEEDGSMEVPADFNEIGWFAPGGVPGGRGPTVIAAHVDSPTGPAAFIDLRRLTIGDVITVATDDGMEHAYAVTRIDEHPKNAFPTAAVFGATSVDALRLVTCSGDFDAQSLSYTSNLVVFAERADVP